MIEFLKSQSFIKHFILASIAIALMLTGIFFSLSAYTRHGESTKVPSVLGKNFNQAKDILLQNKLNIKIADSIFVLDRMPGEILDQDPSTNEMVKEGRSVYVTINSLVPPGVKMPDLKFVSLRQAEAILQTYGLKTGKLSYEPDLAKDAVLKQMFKGKLISAGEEIPKASSIDLVLGDGRGNTEIQIPDLTGMSRVEALVLLKGIGLNVGMEVYEDGADSSTAVVYKQEPLPSSDQIANQGDYVNIYLK